VKQDAWRQIQAGVALINQSRLASWDPQTLRFSAANEQTFEAGHVHVDPKYGRLICWLVFAVGVEYLCRGVCAFKGLPVHDEKPKNVIRTPKPGEDLETWTELVNQGMYGAPDVQDLTATTKNFMQVVEQVGQIKELGVDIQRTKASLRFLASTIRNRDAHQYVQNVRGSSFLAVPELLVPSLNRLLEVVDPCTLSECAAGTKPE